MKAVVQRVLRSSVSIDGKIVGSIGVGLNVLLGVGKGDSESDAEYLAGKIMRLRIFPDEDGKMNRSVAEACGDILVISQFTLYGDCRKGNRPSYSESGDPWNAERLYEYFADYIAGNFSGRVERGEFGAHMDVMIENDGPVTLILESRKKDA